jgi:hypothetical protein
VAVHTVTAAADGWDPATLRWTDAGRAPGRYRYEVRVSDADGNSALGAAAELTLTAPEPTTEG